MFDFNAGEFFMVAPDTDLCSLRFLIKELKINKFIFFKRHTQDYRSMLCLISEIRYLAYPAIPLIAVDEEGGLVSRLSHIIGELPGAMALANCNENTLHNAMTHLHRGIKQLGFNLNFMPVLDILNNYSNTSISTRSYGYDHETVKRCAGIVIQAVKDKGVYYCYKHFPGLGRADLDSHFELPQINHKKEELMSDAMIYKVLFDKFKHHFVMIAHCFYPDISCRISTFSSDIIEGLLKGEMGFMGVVVSDDLLMGALDGEKQIENRAINAFRAGIDLMLVSKLDERFFKMYQAFEKKLRDSNIKTSRLNDAKSRLSRIIKEDAFPESYNPQAGIIPEKLLKEISYDLYEKARIIKPAGERIKDIEVHIPSNLGSYSPVSENHVFTSDGIADLGEIAVRVYESDKGPDIEYISKDCIYIILSINPFYNENCLEKFMLIDKDVKNFYLLSMGEPQENSFIRNAISIINLYTSNRTVVLSALKRLLSDIAK